MKPQALVCEDNVALRAVLGRLLEAHGWAASEAATTAEAIALARSLRPDLVVLDIEFSGMSGLESIPRVRAGCPAARVVAMSTSDLLPSLCLGVGACAVVTASDLERLDRVLGGLEVAEAA